MKTILYAALCVALLACDKGSVTVETVEHTIFTNSFDGSDGSPALHGWKIRNGGDSAFTQDAPPGFTWSISLREREGLEPESLVRSYSSAGSGIYEFRVWTKFVPATIGGGAPARLTIQIGTSHFSSHVCSRDTTWHEEVLRDTLKLATLEVIDLGIHGGYVVLGATDSKALFSDISLVQLNQ